MKIKDSYWFTGLNFTIGIVVGEDEATGKNKGYIGVVPGFDQEADTKLIARQGSPVFPGPLAEIDNYLKQGKQPYPDWSLKCIDIIAKDESLAPETRLEEIKCAIRKDGHYPEAYERGDTPEEAWQDEIEAFPDSQ